MTRKFEKISRELFEKTVPNGFYDSIKLPERATEKSAGYDFRSPVVLRMRPNTTYLIPTGIKCQLDTGDVLNLYSRSSMAIKFGITLANNVAVVDADYYNNPDNEGHIFIALRNGGYDEYRIELGDKIAQGVISSYFVTDNDEAYNIRTGGIGSTGL